MTTKLERYRDWCRRMAEAEHKPECVSLTAKRPDILHPRYDDEGRICAFGIDLDAMAWQPPKCDGCNPESDRALFRRLAEEADEYVQGSLL